MYLQQLRDGGSWGGGGGGAAGLVFFLPLSCPLFSLPYLICINRITSIVLFILTLFAFFY